MRQGPCGHSETDAGHGKTCTVFSVAFPDVPRDDLAWDLATWQHIAVLCAAWNVRRKLRVLDIAEV